MNKGEFITAAAEKAGLSKKDTEIALKAFLETITNTVTKGGKVSFIGFGSFEARTRSARTARVPGTNKTIKLPKTQVVKFKVGKALKDSVAGK